MPLGRGEATFRPGRVEVDGEVVADLDEPILMVAVGNGPHVGGGTELTPTPTRATAGSRHGDAGGRAAGQARARLSWRSAGTRSATTSGYVRGSTVSVSGEAFWCSADGEIDGRSGTDLAGRARGVLPGRAPLTGR